MDITFQLKIIYFATLLDMINTLNSSHSTTNLVLKFLN